MSPIRPDVAKSGRPRKVQRALDTLGLYDEIIGAAEVADLLGVEVSNLKWQKVPVWKRISNGRIPVYLRSDVEASRRLRERKAMASE